MKTISIAIIAIISFFIVSGINLYEQLFNKNNENGSE